MLSTLTGSSDLKGKKAQVRRDRDLFLIRFNYEGITTQNKKYLALPPLTIFTKERKFAQRFAS